MRRENLVLCGAIIMDGEVNEVHSDPTTGELCFELGDSGCAYVIGEVTVDNPITIPNITALPKLLASAGLIGAIYTKTGALAILSEYVAEWRPLQAIMVSNGNTFTIDTMIEAEFEEDNE